MIRRLPRITPPRDNGCGGGFNISGDERGGVTVYDDARRCELASNVSLEAAFVVMREALGVPIG